MAKPEKPSSTAKLIRENQRLKDDLRHLKSARLASNVTPILRDLIKYGFLTAGACFIAWQIAGKVTSFTAVLQASLDAKAAEELGKALGKAVAPTIFILVFFFLAFVFSIWTNRRSKKLNRDLVRDLAFFRKQYEMVMNPNRRSSRLGHDGETRKEDRI